MIYKKDVVSKLISTAIKAISVLDKRGREASIFANICMLKITYPDEFESALITFLRCETNAINRL